MEQRKLKVIFSKSGGTAGKGGVTTRLTLPKKWIDEMDITSEDRDVKVTFSNNKIIIEKNPEENAVWDHAKLKNIEIKNKAYSKMFETHLELCRVHDEPLWLVDIMELMDEIYGRELMHKYQIYIEKKLYGKSISEIISKERNVKQ